MLRKSILVVFCALLLGPAWPASAALVGWWQFDETSGNVATDSSGQGNDGAIVGPPQWVPGKIGGALQFNGSTYVNCGNKPSLNIRNQITMAFWFKVQAFSNTWETFLAKGDGAYRSARSGGTGNATHMGVTGANYFDAVTVITDNQWHHWAGTYDGTTAKIYIDGKVDAQATYGGQIGDSSAYNLYIGENAQATGRFLHGLLDDVQIYDNALTVVEIQSIMKGLSNKSLAVNVSPVDAATDVPRDATLNWIAGQYPATHDVYFGAVAADVNNATRTNMDLLVSQGQADTSFDPAGVFAYGQTYYWRIDEVNTSADGTIYKGGVWSFTAEPYGYPITKITATASSAAASMGPEKTIDGSGLTGDLHGTEGTTMWLTGGAKPNWIQYQFDKVYKLFDLKVWNSNQLIESFLGFGAKSVTIETSADGTTWTALADVPEFAQATGMAGYAANTTVNMGGVMAKYVKLTINSNWGGMAPQTGLSEVRFSYIPVQARAPQPATAATGIAVDPSLNWRPGREAGSHQVFFGTDPNAVANGTASAKSVADHAFTPGSLNFGTAYYWQVSEVNTVTYPGDVWSFTTQEYAAVDNFETYNDSDNRLYDAWIDGYTDGQSGSLVGYLTTTNGTFAETTVIHGGKQSMPFEYNNVKAPYYSEASRTFDATQNWTTNGADTLSLYFIGRAVGFVDNGNNAFTMSASGTDIWNNSDQFRFAYKQLNGNGSITARVDSIGATDVWAKGAIMIRESLDAGSKNVAIAVSSSSGVSAQWRDTTNGTSANSGTAGLVAPYWVRVTRTGNVFKEEHSADGKTWTQQGTDTTVTMAASVYIGLA
ncbi:MAG: discoidin domain-containing protein, partial [Phycisphaerae bacterium]|nr:discoidin domain-containing protein [Phycisphaerae bacterium]